MEQAVSEELQLQFIPLVHNICQVIASGFWSSKFWLDPVELLHVEPSPPFDVQLCAAIKLCSWYFKCAGPHLLDLGDCLYAPNCFRDAQGRNVMLGWLQELRKGGGFDYAGCISLPRILTYKGTTHNPL